jgi:pantoate--beta-alanine ligase
LWFNNTGFLPLSSTSENRMARRPLIVRRLPALRRTIHKLRADDEKIALVPTMGALHAGHIALVRLARRRARRVVVSIFVNPAQFAPTEDFASYPRAFDADIAALENVGVDAVWAPAVDDMYAPGFATRIVPDGAAKVGLEDAFRPHFFNGVATVVAKLLVQCAPDIAVFGEKDFQQLKVIEQTVTDLDLPVKIVGAPTVREPDGLAVSSRNAYLSAEHRAVAPTLFRVLTDCARRIADKAHIARTLDEGGIEIQRAGFGLDYLEVRHSRTLAKVETAGNEPLRLLVAARIGQTRLIDNVPV